jgi:hypothetical protein
MAEPLTLRYNNPGAIEYKPWQAQFGATLGPNGRYAQFPDKESGYKAMEHLLGTYRSKHGLNTITGIVNRWAPPNVDNNSTGMYTAHVAKTLGVDPNAPLDPTMTPRLAEAMAAYEAGRPVPRGPMSPADPEMPGLMPGAPRVASPVSPMSAAPAGAAPAMTTPYNGPSPDDVAQKRRMAQMLMQDASSATPVGHWTQALARVLQGGVGGVYQSQAKQGEQQGTQAMVQALSGGQMNPAAMVANPWTRQFGMELAKSQFAQNTPQAQAELQGTQLQNQMRQRQLAQPVDDGSKVLESGGQIFRVPRQGDATVIGGMDPVVQAQKQADARRAQVVAAGIDPTSPAGKAYIASGKMPREDQQPLTATDKKAILEADEASSRGQGVLENLDKAIELSKKAYTGPTAGLRGYGASLFGIKGGAETEELSNVITSNSLSELKSIFGGNPTEGERKILLDIQGSVNKAPEVREKIFARAKQMAQRRLDLARKQAEEIRGGDYYKAAKDRKQPAEAEKPAATDLKAKYGLE